MIEVENKVTVYEVDGVETLKLPKEPPPLIVRSHPTCNKFVILDLSSGRLTVAASDLERAVRNATNTKY